MEVMATLPVFSENKVETGHVRRSLSSGAVSIAARGLNAAIQVGSALYLARLLSPQDFGLVGMVTALTGFAYVVSLGTPDVVTQRSSINEREVAALFWISLSLGFGLTALTWACGPLISRFYGEPRLQMIVLVSALTFVMSALHCQHYALLRRAMRFQELAVIDVTASLLSAAVAIAMALLNFGYWALAVRPVAMNAFVAAGVWLRVRWFPKRPAITAASKEMVKLGLNITGFTMTDFFGKSADKVAIGYASGAIALGYYQNALFVYENLLDVLSAPLHSVAVAGLSKVASDLKELKRLWSKAMLTLGFYAMPAFGILAVTAQDLVVVVLGTKWANAGVLLSILALRGIPHSVERTMGWLHVVAGRTDRWLRWGIAANCFQFVALLCGLRFGARGVVIAYVACTSVLFLPAISYAGQPLGIGASDVIRVSWRPFAGSLLAAAIGFTLRYTVLAQETGILRTFELAFAYLAAYLVVVMYLFRLRAPVGALLQLAGDVMPPWITRVLQTRGL
ncbi:MAG: lipopolysaccharide biosynthesis protein [Bryobacterales bacterium]|nr:lipopolysaccharide biosynthesis protein [Bryobacterales bacterium]